MCEGAGALQGWLRFSQGVDTLNRWCGAIATWMVLFACLISALNAASRYLFSVSSNAWLEIQWYLFAGIVLLGAAYTLKMNEHVRVDVIFSRLAPRTRVQVTLFGLIVFLMPAMLVLAWLSWPMFVESWMRHEMSSNAGGLVRWPAKILLPIGFVLMALQGISEIIKRIAHLRGIYELETRYERPVQ